MFTLVVAAVVAVVAAAVVAVVVVVVAVVVVVGDSGANSLELNFGSAALRRAVAVLSCCHGVQPVM